MGSGGRSSGFYGAEATLEGNHDIQFLYTSLLSLYVICMLHVCVGGGMGCTHVKYGGQRSMLGVFLNHFPVLVRQGLY